MASGFGTFTSSTYFTSGNGRGYLRAWVSQTVNSSARTVKITVDAYLTYYRNGGGNWNPGTSNLFYNHSSGNYIKATVDGSTATSGQNLGLKGNNTTLNVGGYYTTRNSAVAANTVAAQSKSTTFNYNDNGDAITKSWSASIKYGSTTMSVSGNVTTDSIAAAYTPPSGLSVGYGIVQDDNVDLYVAAEDPGVPSSLAGFQIFGALLEQSTYGPPYKYSYISEELEGTVLITNDSSGSPNFAITPNTEYYYGVYATNSAATDSLVEDTIITLPAHIESIDIISNNGGTVNLRLNHAPEGSDDTVHVEYSINGTNWTATTDTPTLIVNTPTTYRFRRRNSFGAMPAYSITISPKHVVYGSVNGVAKRAKKLYGSVGGQSKKIKKLYCSVDGRSKLIYVDES